MSLAESSLSNSCKKKLVFSLVKSSPRIHPAYNIHKKLFKNQQFPNRKFSIKLLET